LADFSDYIVFVDESGDHGLVSIDPQFPVFTLAFCVISKAEYASTVVPAFQSFKFDFWGHDGVVLHEHEMRRQEGEFGFLRTDPVLRGNFLTRITGLIEEAPFKIIAATIDKTTLTSRYTTPYNPYEIALRFCMENLLQMMIREGQAGRNMHVMFESRGKKEDNELELEFRRICANGARWGYKAPDFTWMSFAPRFLPKKVNSTGLQMADLVARPIALKTFRPEQTNRAFDSLSSKISFRKSFP